MRKALIPAFLLLLGSLVLGATVMREPLAHAASAMSVMVSNSKSSPVPVQEVNTDSSGNIKVHEQGTAAVHEQGTADVNVTNTSIPTAPPSPVTGGGDSRGCSVSVGTCNLTSTSEATALSIHMDAGVDTLNLLYQGNAVASFRGPVAGGNSSIVLALTRPIRMDQIACLGPGTTDLCTVSWVGNSP